MFEELLAKNSSSCIKQSKLPSFTLELYAREREREVPSDICRRVTTPPDLRVSFQHSHGFLSSCGGGEGIGGRNKGRWWMSGDNRLEVLGPPDWNFFLKAGPTN
jgi:hypothetical protein